MFCTNCGAKLQENAKFCIYCGHPVEIDETVPPQVAQSTQPIPQHTESEPPVQTENAPASAEQPAESAPQPTASEAPVQTEEAPASAEQQAESTPQPTEAEASEQTEEDSTSAEQSEESTSQPAASEEAPMTAEQPEESAPQPTEAETSEQAKEAPVSTGQSKESTPSPVEPKTAVQTLEAPPAFDLESEWEEEEAEEIPLARRLLPLWIGLGTVALTAVAFAVIQCAPIGPQVQADGSAVASSSSVSETEETNDQQTDGDTQTPDSSEEATPPVEEEPIIVEEFRVSSVMTDEIREQGGKYINHRFDYTLAVPDGFVASNEFQGGDGLRLYSAEYDMRITVYSGYQTSKTTEELFNQACAEIPGTLGYSACGEDWYAVSSEDEEGMVHYRKYGAWDDKYRVMELIYPKANEEVCDQLTEELEDGFVSGTPD